MEKIYDLVLLTNYIDGKITDSKLLKELEDDPIFMKTVIYATNNKKIYDRCSKKVKQNIDFVKFVVYQFKDDKEFITSVADYFLLKSNNSDRFELSIIMAELIDEPNNKYEAICESLFKIFNINVEKMKSKLEDSSIAKRTEGFIWVKSHYFSEKIRSYCAKKMAIRLALSNNNLERYLHEKYKSFEPIKRNTKKVLIDFISMYDMSLSQYLVLNPTLLSCLDDVLNIIEDNFSNYFELKKQEEQKTLIERLNDYSSTHEPGLLSFEEIIFYASMEAEILESMLKHYNFRSANYMEIIKISEEVIKSSLIDLINYRNIIKIIQTTLGHDNDPSTNQTKCLGRIIKLQV